MRPRISIRGSVRPSVRRSVGPSVRRLVRHARVENAKNARFTMLQLSLNVCVYVSVWGGGWGEAGGWLPLPTRPQRYCDPVSLVAYNIKVIF